MGLGWVVHCCCVCRDLAVCVCAVPFELHTRRDYFRSSRGYRELALALSLTIYLQCRDVLFTFARYKAELATISRLVRMPVICSLKFVLCVGFGVGVVLL